MGKLETNDAIQDVADAIDNGAAQHDRSKDNEQEHQDHTS